MGSSSSATIAMTFAFLHTLRVDARLQRTFISARHGVTVFGEVLNVLNRRNEGLADGVVQPVTGEAVGFSRPLVSRSASIGIEVGFRR